MGRNSCNVKQKLRKGLWSPEEDEKLYNHIKRFGVGCWSSVPKLAGLQRCGKSCRLRWINYLRPDLKRGRFSQEEEVLIISLHEALGNRWAQIATQLPGRTDNEIKNFWNSSLKKKLIKQGIDPNTHKPISESSLQLVREDKATIPQPNGLPNLSVSSLMDQQQQLFHLNQVYDDASLLLSDPNGYQASFLPHCHVNNHPITGFDSMPDLTSFDHQNMIDTDYSDNSSSRLSKYLMNEAKDSSSNTSMVGNAHENTWDVDDRLESMFEFEYMRNGQSSREYNKYPMSQEFNEANVDLFHQI